MPDLAKMRTAGAVSEIDKADAALLLECVSKRRSFLAAKLLGEQHQLTVCRSGAGFYLGCTDENGPVARDSGYYPTGDAAQAALDNHDWEQRLRA